MRHHDGNEERAGIVRRIWRSVAVSPVRPRNDRERKRMIVENLVLHFRPVHVPEKTIPFTHTFGLGGMSLVLFLTLAASGVLLLFVYVPSPEAAYPSIITLHEAIGFGKLVRSAHYWSANLLIVVVALHLLRVYLTGGYHGPRQFNWVIGLGLLLLVLVANLTGYLLPWDQLSYWATTIVIGMLAYVPLVGDALAGMVRGGTDVGASTLVKFYAFHTTVSPLALLALMAWHFWRVRKARGVVVPRAPGEAAEAKPTRVLMVPNLLLREGSAALIGVAVVLVLAVFFPAPLGEAANPGMSPNPAKAPWYFMGIQELQLHFHPLFSVVLIPAAMAVGLLLIPYLRYDEDTAGVFMSSRRGRRLGVVALVAALVLTPVWIAADEWWLDFAAWLPGVSGAVSNGVLPAGIVAGLLLACYAYLRKVRGVSSNEAVQTLAIFLLAVFVVLTVTGIWFRGEGMMLSLP